MFEFYKEIAKLKSIIRRGWEYWGVPNRLESDAEHTYSMLMLALALMDKNELGLDKEKVIKMIAYHELCEIDAGDTIPMDNVSAQEKFVKELKGLKG